MSVFIEITLVVLTLISFWGLGDLVLGSGFKHERPVYASLLVGSGIFAWSIGTLGTLISLTFLSAPLLIAGLVRSFLSLPKSYLEKSKINLPLIVVVYLGVSFFISLYPSSYFDPLNYHLFGIVEWAKLDRLIHIESAIQLMHVSFADYLFFPFALILNPLDLDHLVSIQVSSQLLTVFMGITLTSLLLADFFKNKMNHFWVGLIILAALFRASLQHKGLIAKNDWIAISWFLGGMIFLFNSKVGGKYSVWWGGFLMGISIGSKLTYGIPFLLVLVIFRFSPLVYSRRFLMVFVSMITISALPYFIKNYLWTGNPVFPVGARWFPQEFMGPSWVEGLRFFDIGLDHFKMSDLSGKLHRIFTYEEVSYFSLLLPWFFRQIDKRVVILWSGLFIFFMTYVLFTGPASETRHFAPLAISLNMLGVYTLMLICQRYLASLKLQILVVSFFVFLMSFHALRLEDQLNAVPKAVREGILLPRTATLIQDKRGLLLAQHLPHILKEGDRPALLDDTPPYYLSPYGISRLWDDPVLDRALDKCRDINCVVTLLESHGITHLIETNFLFDGYYRPGVINVMKRAMKLFPDIIVFQDNGENLISVALLKKHLP